MNHSITFGTKNTWDDWKLIPSSRPVFNPPTVKTKYVDIPGADGLLDISTILTGRPVYGNRVGEFEFIVYDQETSWESVYSNIANHLHGRHMYAILEDDPQFFYEGRFTVNQWRSEHDFSRIVISYSVAPFKKLIDGDMDTWLWNPFNFETGVIPDYKNLVVNGTDSLTVDIVGTIMPVVPTFITTEAMSVKFNGLTYQLPQGVSKVPAISIVLGDNRLTFSGNGLVTIVYRGGSL